MHSMKISGLKRRILLLAAFTASLLGLFSVSSSYTAVPGAPDGGVSRISFEVNPEDK